MIFFSVVKLKRDPPILRRVHTFSYDNSFTLKLGIGKVTGGHLFFINDIQKILQIICFDFLLDFIGPRGS